MEKDLWLDCMLAPMRDFNHSRYGLRGDQMKEQSQAVRGYYSNVKVSKVQ